MGGPKLSQTPVIPYISRCRVTGLLKPLPAFGFYNIMLYYTFKLCN